MNPDTHDTTQTPTPSLSPTWKHIVKEIFIFVAIAGGIVLPFRMFIAEPYIVNGSSMDPTFINGDYLIVDKLSYEIGNPKRNSVVVFKFPTETSRNLIKRIIGLPGDTVTMNDKVITITNTENPEGFTLDQRDIKNFTTEHFSITLKENEYFVMGDNRGVSYDSRSWGILPRSDILGRPVVRLWPVNKISILPGDLSNL